jgi:hypothetical protein
MSNFETYEVLEQKQVRVNRTPSVFPMFEGKTIGQIGKENGLQDEDFDFTEEKNTKTGQTVYGIGIRIKGVEYLFPMSRDLSKKYDTLDLNTLLNCKARVSYLSVKDAEGNPLFDDNGKIVLSETEKTLSIGLPEGQINIANRVNGIETALANTEVTA